MAVRPPQAEPWVDRVGHIAVLGMAASLCFPRALFHACALIVVVCWLVGGHHRQLPSLLWRCCTLLAISALVLLVLISGFYTRATPAEWLSQVHAYAKLLVVPMMLAFLQRRDQISRGWWALGSGLLVLWIFFTVDRWFEIPGTRSARLHDQGVFNNYIVEGLNLGALALLGLAAAWHHWKQRPLLALACLFGGLAGAHAVLFVNPGRGAQLALVGGLTVLAFFALPRRVRWPGLVLVLAAMFMVIGQSDVIISRFKEAHADFKSMGTGPLLSVGSRLAAWRTSLELWTEQPLLGHGAGAYAPLAKALELGRPGGCTDNPACLQPHNQYLYLLVETGLAGLLIFCGILVGVMRLGRGCVGMARVLAPAFGVLFAIHSCFDSGLRMGTQVFIFLVMTALLAAEQLQQQASGRDQGWNAAPTGRWRDHLQIRWFSRK